MIAAILAAAAFACSAPSADQTPQPAAAQPPAPPAQPPAADLSGGWKARFDDDAAAGNGGTLRADAEKDSVTFTTGPAAIYYKPDLKAEKDYSLTATFSQLKPSTPPQPYG